MNAKMRTGLWVAFWLSSLITLIADFGFFGAEWRSVVRLMFGIVSVGLGFAILATRERSGHSVALVATGLVISQWWLIKWAAAFAMWSVGGFAP